MSHSPSHSSIKELFLSTKKIRRRRPQINETEEGEERKVYRLDLFFDLVFVIAIGQLAHMFHGEITRKLIFEFVILFVPVWRTWITATFYVARFEDFTIRHRIYLFALMIPVLGMGYAIHGALGDLAPWFVGSYALSKLLLARMRYTAGDEQTQSNDLKKVTKTAMRTNVVIALIWVGSLFIPAPFRYLIRFATMAGELFNSYRFRSTQDDDVPDYDLGHLTERFGLLTIVVLAEIIIGVFAGVNELHHLSFTVIITAIAAFLIACILWWIYFDFIMYRPLKREHNENQKLFLWSYGHLPLTLGITIVGGSLTHLIHMAGDHLELFPLRVFVGGLCLVLVSIAYLVSFHQANNHDEEVNFGGDDTFNRVIVISILRVVALLTAWSILFSVIHLPVHWFVIGVVALLLILVVEGMVHWLRAIVASENSPNTD